MTLFAAGFGTVWTSPVVAKLQSNGTDIYLLSYSITSYDISLIIAFFSLGNLVILPIAGKLADDIGTKNFLTLIMMLNVVFLVGLAYARNIMWILIARFVTGMCCGGSLLVVPIFLTEITDDHNRGKFGCLMGIFMPLGQLYAYVMGFFFSVKYFTLSCAFPMIVGTMLFLFFITETPVKLLFKGDRKGAARSLAQYKGHLRPHEIEKNLQLMECTIEKTTNGKNVSLISSLSHPTTRRGLLISFGVLATQTGSGVAVLMSFMGPIFEEAQTGLSGNMTAILVGFISIIFFFFVSHIIEKLGRKLLLLLSSISCSISLCVLGIYFFMKEHHFYVYQNISWLPVFSIMFFIIGYSLGLGPIPMITLSELFAIDVRAQAISTITFFVTILGSVILTAAPILINHIGHSGCMWIFSVNCLLGAVFIHWKVPETKGKSIQEIHEILNAKTCYLNIHS